MTSAIYSDIRPTEKHPEQTFQDLLRAYIISLFFHKVKQADLFHLKIRQHQSFHFLTFHMGCFHSLHAVADAGFEEFHHIDVIEAVIDGVSAEAGEADKLRIALRWSAQTGCP